MPFVTGPVQRGLRLAGELIVDGSGSVFDGLLTRCHDDIGDQVMVSEI
jgi:hypothetical protein